jgi:hypothetical protein
MNEHLILYIDFLGSKAAIREWEKDKTDKLEAFIRLLHDVAALRSDFASFREMPVEGGTQAFIKPVISTFSDHVVISYPTENLRELKLGGEGRYLWLFLWKSQRQVAAIAAAAMNLGLLIRGSATVGPLHHENGVVFGKAMVEAYDLESSVSLYPRITVSRKIYSQQVGTDDLMLLKDHDGITHLNYFSDMIFAGGQRPPGSQFFFMPEVNIWLTDARKTIAENIDRFEQEERWNELAKWVWFKAQLEQARAALPDAIFEETGPSAG